MGRSFRLLWLRGVCTTFSASADGHLDGGVVPAAVRSAAVSMGVRMSLWDRVFISFLCAPRSGAVGSCSGSVFDLSRKRHAVFRNDHTVYIPMESAQRCSFLYTLINTCYRVSFCQQHFTHDEVTLLFWCVSPWWLVGLSTFLCTSRPSLCHLWKNLFLAQFSTRFVLSCWIVCALHVLGIHPTLDVCVRVFCFCSVGAFGSALCCLCCAETPSSMCPVDWLCFRGLCFGVISKTLLPGSLSDVFLVFSSKGFIVAVLMLSPFQWYSLGSNSVILLVVFHYSQHHLWKRMSFPHWIFLPLLLNISWPYMGGFISELLILFHCLWVTFYATTILFWFL